MASAAPKVEFQKLVREPIELKRDLPCRVVSNHVAKIRPQKGGLLKERLFEDGGNVEAGQILYRIDDAPLKTEYDTAIAWPAQAVSREDATRHHMESCILLAKNSAVRLKERDDSIAAFTEVKESIDTARKQFVRNPLYLFIKAVDPENIFYQVQSD